MAKHAQDFLCEEFVISSENRDVQVIVHLSNLPSGDQEVNALITTPQEEALFQQFLSDYSKHAIEQPSRVKTYLIPARQSKTA